MAQDTDTTGHGDSAGGRRQFTGDQLQQCRLADTVAPDQTGTFETETKIDIGKKWMTVRRRPREVRKSDGVRHGYYFPE
ncbi:hypothetical protein AGR5A_Lc110089 [Agrobacterium genomosp. 5 str. CFBP 6626]|nr:hypothetical protein AGR5A_Lc110089 [Agrobacterium genomosp. 5 str. CFBP 6626]